MPSILFFALATGIVGGCCAGIGDGRRGNVQLEFDDEQTNVGPTVEKNGGVIGVYFNAGSSGETTADLQTRLSLTTWPNGTSVVTTPAEASPAAPPLDEYGMPYGAVIGFRPSTPLPNGWYKLDFAGGSCGIDVRSAQSARFRLESKPMLSTILSCPRSAGDSQLFFKAAFSETLVVPEPIDSAITMAQGGASCTSTRFANLMTAVDGGQSDSADGILFACPSLDATIAVEVTVHWSNLKTLNGDAVDPSLANGPVFDFTPMGNPADPADNRCRLLELPIPGN